MPLMSEDLIRSLGLDPTVKPASGLPPAPVACLEYHNHSVGSPEINLVTPDGKAILIPAEYLPILRKAMEYLAMAIPGTARGEVLFVDVDSEGRVEFLKRKEG